MRTAILLELPTGQSTKDMPLTVGRTYQIMYRNGSNVCISTDDPLLTAHVWQGRVKVLKDDDPTTITLTASEARKIVQMARDFMFLHPTAGEKRADGDFTIERLEEIKDALSYGDLVQITPMPFNDRRKRPKPAPEPVLTMKDVRAAAKAKGATVTGTGGDYDVEAPKGMKWDGDLHSFVLTFNPKDAKDSQAAFKDVIERIKMATLEPYDASEDE